MSLKSRFMCFSVRLAIYLVATVAVLTSMPVQAFSSSVTIMDRKGDVSDEALDTVQGSLTKASDGRLRFTLTLAREWSSEDLVSSRGRPPGSLCLKLWIGRDATGHTPKYLVCLTPFSGGGESALKANVVRERSGRLRAKTVASAEVSRPSARSVVVKFAQSAVGTPTSFQFAFESVAGSECWQSTRCLDATAVKRFSVR